MASFDSVQQADVSVYIDDSEYKRPIVQVLYRDDHYIVVDKPSGMFVHRTGLDHDPVVLLQLLRDQIGQKLYPVHRLDKPTSGVMAFALSSDAARLLWHQFQEKSVIKVYHALVRGFVDGANTIDYDLVNKNNLRAQTAVTHYKMLKQFEYPVAVGPYETTRVSLLELTLETGRMHQIRRHMKHIFHPVVGDTTYGDAKYNRLFRDTQVHRLMLQSIRMSFLNPISQRSVDVELPEVDRIEKQMESLSFD